MNGLFIKKSINSVVYTEYKKISMHAIKFYSFIISIYFTEYWIIWQHFQIHWIQAILQRIN